MNDGEQPILYSTRSRAETTKIFLWPMVDEESSYSSLPSSHAAPVLRIRPRFFHQPGLQLKLTLCTPELAQVLSRPHLSQFECFLGSVAISNRVLLFSSEAEWYRLSCLSFETQLCLDSALHIGH